MSIETKDSVLNALSMTMEEKFAVSQCFYCGKALKGRFVFWAGSTGFIGLHASCVSELFWKLEADALELKTLRCNEKKS